MASPTILNTIRTWLHTAIAAALMLTGCTGAPKGSHPIAHLDIPRYLGTWYEIARFDHRFERGLECVTATYALRPDGRLSVINRGRNNRTRQWKEVEGKASTLMTPADGRLKVSFFGPFYSGYNILALDADYQYALVAGPNHRYLWILSRTPMLDEAHYDKLIAIAQSQGFDTSALIRIHQKAANCTTL